MLMIFFFLARIPYDIDKQLNILKDFFSSMGEVGVREEFRWGGGYRGRWIHRGRDGEGI
jgi:hypothetical protein